MKKIIKKLNHNIKNKKHITRKHVCKKLRKRLKIFFIIIFIILGISAHKIFRGDVSFPLAIFSLSIGTAIGLIAGRMFKTLWHEEEQQVVTKLDRMGTVILVIYIGIEIGKKWIFGHWLNGNELNAFALIFLAGLLIGRLFAMIKGIRKVLIEEKKICDKFF